MMLAMISIIQNVDVRDWQIYIICQAVYLSEIFLVVFLADGPLVAILVIIRELSHQCESLFVFYNKVTIPCYFMSGFWKSHIV